MPQDHDTGSDAPPTPRLARRIGLVLGPVLFLFALLLPLPVLDSAAPDFRMRATLGLALWMAAWWMTEALPLAASSLLPLVVMPACGVMTAPAAASHFFSDIVALFLGGFCLALAMQKAGLHRRIAMVVLRIFGSRPRRLVLGFLCASALLSMWVSNTATTLMLIPVVLTVTALPGPRTPQMARFAAACLLAVAFGASIGGVGTTIGTPPNVFLAGFYNQHYEARIAAGELAPITFGRWMLVGVPLVLALVPACWLLLTRLSPGVPRDFAADVKLQHAGRISAAEATVMGLFLITALAWITRAPVSIGEAVLPLTGWDRAFSFGAAGTYISEGTISIAAALALFLLPDWRKGGERLLTWEFAAPRLPWGALLLFGGGLALAQGLKDGGVIAYLTAAFGTLAGVPLWLVILVVILCVTVISELASNTASAAMAIPVLASLAAALGVEPGPLLMAAALGASCGYALPVATPPNTIVYATGEVTVAQMVKAGALLDVIAAAAMYAVVMLLARAVL